MSVQFEGEAQCPFTRTVQLNSLPGITHYPQLTGKHVVIACERPHHEVGPHAYWDRDAKQYQPFIANGRRDPDATQTATRP